MEKYCSDACDLAARVAEVRARIDAAARRAHRNPRDILLIAATKTQSASRVRQALDAGVDAAGENRVQELLEKWEQGAYQNKPLHFIGHLQQNKVKQVVGRAALIHSVDSIALGEAIAAQADRLGLRQEALLQVNIGREKTKGGFLPEELPTTLERLVQLKGLWVKGLMVIPPPIGSDKGIAENDYFMETKQLLIDNLSFFMHTGSSGVLSMGMSGDYERAVEAGAHMVRVGEAIFGARNAERPGA